MVKNTNYSLLNNSRFYILAFSFLLSLTVLAYLRLQIPSDSLWYIRTQQTFGYICIAFWYTALIISPIGYVIGKQRTKKLEFARRAIGVSAFYFALLHAAVAFWGQLGGFAQVLYLPELFKWSLLGGLIALIVLFLMASTSFDAVIKFMTYRKWKWLHRFVYMAGILAVLHIWTLGTHLAYTNVQLAAYVALVVFVGLELFRTTKLMNRKYLQFKRTEVGVLFFSAWMIAAVIIFMIPSYVQNYHNRHTGHEQNGDTSQHKHQGGTS